MGDNSERRRYERTRIQVFFRGSIEIKGVKLDFVATSVNLSLKGTLLRLSDDTRARLASYLKDEASIKGALLKVKIVSYVEENLSVKAKAVFIKRSDGAVFIGAGFVNLGAEAVQSLERIIEKRPDLIAENKKALSADYKFESVGEFINEVTAFSVLVDRKEKFWIKNEQFTFAGMHMSRASELHKDCIESVRNPNRIYCPDCRDLISPMELL